ncbi:hypothetical protein G6M50_03925 [Agrobacterium rhizogenes]|nr:hypothetical protein [Rhizobium rhizogenes]NTJ76948.1 hypothetical protein [Rhizobium rhizogenes]
MWLPCHQEQEVTELAKGLNRSNSFESQIKSSPIRKSSYNRSRGHSGRREPRLTSYCPDTKHVASIRGLSTPNVRFCDGSLGTGERAESELEAVSDALETAQPKTLETLQISQRFQEVFGG